MEYSEAKKYITIDFADNTAYLFSAKIKDVLSVYYVAVRGRDNVEGAVQRVLNKRRISSIKDFVLDGNTFLNTFILNWTENNYSIIAENGLIKFPLVNAAAQVIDGQHRLEGLKLAFSENEKVGEQEIVVILTKNLSTKDAANIFVNINTEQKPVPQSLVYDLFGEIKDRTSNIVRATDIANRLHEDIESPYYQCIKKPGASQGVGKVDLSTVVNSIKEYLKDDGVLEQYKFTDFEIQYRIIFNFLTSLKYFYSKEGCWLNNKNPFMANAGFFSAMKFLHEDLIVKCKERKSFEVSVITEMLNLNEVGLLLRDDIKNKQGKEQRTEIYKYLKNALLKDVPDQNEYKF